MSSKEAGPGPRVSDGCNRIGAHLDRTGLVPALRILFVKLTPARRRMLVPVMALMLAGAVAEVATIGALVPFLGGLPSSGRALDAPFFGLALPVPTETLPLFLIGLFATVAFVSACLRLMLLWTSASFVNGMAYELATRIYSDTLQEAYSFHTRRNSSEIIAMVNKVQMLTWQVLHPLMTGIIALTISCFIVVGLMVVDVWAALFAGAIFVAIYVGVSALTRDRLRRNSVVIARAQEERIRAMHEGLGGIRDILLDQSQAVFVDVYDRTEARFRAASVKNTFLSGAPRFVVEAAGMVMIAAVAVLASSGPGGILDAIPTLGALALGAQRLVPLLQQLYSAWASIMGSRQIVLDVVALLSRNVTTLALVSPMPFERSIGLRDVGFTYQVDGASILAEVNVEIPKGARVGIRGKTGSGKSTLVDIVLGLLEPSAGVICIDGVPLTPGTCPAWQRNVAHVPQAIYLSDASIAENVAFGVSAHLVDRGRVTRAIEQSGLADVVARLPQGYDTRVGERGIQLSGGQRQRLGIARALYKQASVLILDEATSALDHETEAIVMEAIERLDRSLTIVIVAHRTSTLAGCDMVLRVEGGRVVCDVAVPPHDIAGSTRAGAR